MARRRYVSTQISQDTRVNKLAVQSGDFAALLYTWMIPHAADDATLPGDPEELLYLVLPGRRDKTVEDVRAALDGMAALGLIEDAGAGRIGFPACAFYKYQTYIKDRNRQRDERRESAAESAQDAAPAPPEQSDAANQRKSAQNTVSFSPSFSPSHSPSVSHSPPLTPPTPPPRGPLAPPAGGVAARATPKPATLSGTQQARFNRWYATYPNKQHRPEAEKAFARLDPDDPLTDTLVADTARRQTGRKWAEGFIELPATYLHKRVWEDDIEPVRLVQPTRAGPHGYQPALTRSEQRAANINRGIPS